MELDRRTFLQQAGLALFTWGATEAGISSLVNNNRLATSIENYQQTLAQPTNRKLALLVGINRYPNYENLNGCLTDIELQRELLIHRFGFNQSDIITLSDRQATRENIETTFVEHLGQAKADDVVVFHFSGYGGQIKMPLSLDSDGVKNIENTSSQDLDSPGAFRLVNSFMPVDGILSSQKKSRANSILQESLLVLAQSLSTAKCAFILDTSFNTTSASKHNNFKLRSISQVFEDASLEELAFLEKLHANLSTKGLKASKRISSLPGVVLSATSKNQVAAERHWNGFSAGLFTHALTQHLWQITPSSKMQLALSRTAETVEQVMGKQQQPSFNSSDKAIAYYLATSDAPKAVGVISKVDNNGNIEVKLLGLPANLLECYGVNSCFSLVSNDEPQLQVKSKEGLVIKTKLLSSIEPPQVGQLIDESLRMLKRDLKLTLALDFDLERIERVDATSALANIPAVSSAIVSGEQNADCLLGKVNSVPTSEAVTERDPQKPTFSYGLYTAGGLLLDKTMGVEEEAVKIAIDRLQPQFNNLLAAKWLELTNNEFSSKLKVSATLTAEGKKQPTSWQRTTFPLESKQPAKKSLSTNNFDTETANALPLLAKGAEIKLTLNNLGDRQLYALLLGVDSDSDIFALYTPTKPSNAEAEVQLENIEIAPGNELVIPPAENSWQWKAPESVGINTLYAILTVKPFANTLKAFIAQQNFKLDREQVLNVTNPVEVINSLMQDLHDASSVSDSFLPNDDVYALDVNSWATLSFVYEVANV